MGNTVELNHNNERFGSKFNTYLSMVKFKCIIISKLTELFAFKGVKTSD